MVERDRPKYGEQWPGGRFGEVIGPSGKRCYSKDRCAQILGRSGRTIQSLVAAGRLEKDPVPSGSGRQVFIFADGFEERGKWPPSQITADSTGNDAWHELAIRQGHDLELARSNLTAALATASGLEHQVAELTAKIHSLEADERDLRSAISSLGAVMGRSSNAHDR